MNLVRYFGLFTPTFYVLQYSGVLCTPTPVPEYSYSVYLYVVGVPEYGVRSTSTPVPECSGYYSYSVYSPYSSTRSTKYEYIAYTHS
jgi:hypothetical protein